MQAVYLQSDLPIGECIYRMQDRTGWRRWRMRFYFLGAGFGPVCDKPLTGRVDDDGFDVRETSRAPDYLGKLHPAIRAQWRVSGKGTLLRLTPYVTWGQRLLIPLAVSLLAVPLVALAVLTILGTMEFSTLCGLMWAAGLLSYLGALLAGRLQAPRTARRFVQKLGTLLEAHRVDGDALWGGPGAADYRR